MSETTPPVLVEVAVPLPLPQAFTYTLETIPREQVHLGSVLEVPFRRKLTHGFVVGFPATTDVPAKSLKAAKSLLQKEPLFDEAMLKFFRWLSEYYCHPLGEVIGTAIPRLQRSSTESTSKRAPRKSTFLDRIEAKVEAEAPLPLTDEQQAALDAICDPKEKRAVLLHGVTGSGKTEVYLRAAAKVIEAGQSAIVLVPEIALTPQLLDRFLRRFPAQVAILHSGLTSRERVRQWDRIRAGDASLVLGARSAVFAPLVKPLGLIVVDEEHETSYKQDDSFKYHGRDVAVARGTFAGARVVLGSATPSLESLWHAQTNKYRLVKLERRVRAQSPLKIEVVDLRDRNGHVSEDLSWLSTQLLDALRETLAAGHQSMVFLNRLGFSHFLYCRDCGHTWRCVQCDVALTYYRSPPELKCHYCGSSFPPPDLCTKCSGHSVEPVGLGTEQAEAALKTLLPTARIARLDRSAVRTRRELEEILSKVEKREIDIVVGTQMLAKGHDFPAVTLVGVLLADASLNVPDFRARERTFQLLTQVVGRAGRADLPGRAIVQALQPEHPAIVAALGGDKAAFFAEEFDQRRQFGFPPFRRLAIVRFAHKNPQTVETFARECASQLRLWAGRRGWKLETLGPSAAPLSRIQGLYRWQLMMKGEKGTDLRMAVDGVRAWNDQRASSVRVAVDVDPLHFL